MIFAFDRNPIIKLSIDFENWREENIDKRWKSRPHRCTCHVCGYTITEKNYSPAACGWMRLKGKIYNPWICHECLEHHDFMFKSKRDEEKMHYYDH